VTRLLAILSLICAPLLCLSQVSPYPTQATAGVYTVSSGGVVANQLVTLDSTGQAVRSLISSDHFALGIAQATASYGASVIVFTNATIGSCQFENSTTVDDFVVLGTSTYSECRDSGIASTAGIGAVPIGTAVVGVVQQAVSSGATAMVQVGAIIGTQIPTNTYDDYGAAAARAGVDNCGTNEYATGTGISSTPCAQVDYSQLSGTPMLCSTCANLTPSGNQTFTLPTGILLSITQTNNTNNESNFVMPITNISSAQGFNLGNNGTSAQGWSGESLFQERMFTYRRGISQATSVQFDKTAIGDSSVFYGYNRSFGGSVASSDEGVNGIAIQIQQSGFASGTLSSGGTTGSVVIGTTSYTCTNYAGNGCNDSQTGVFFNDGGILLDLKSGFNATITVAYAPNSATFNPPVSQDPIEPNSLAYDISGTSVVASSAWGSIIQSSCTGNGNGQYQTYTSTTCNVTLGSGSGNFSASNGHIFTSGPFSEESAITAAGTPSGGVQSITFLTRYAYDNANGSTNPAVVFQNPTTTTGTGGLSFLVTGTESTWPISYFAIGATSATHIYFANCAGGNCNGITSSNLLNPATAITFYPSAWITGTNGGVQGAAQLGTNHIAFANGDTVVSAPTSQYNSQGLFVTTAQASPAYNSYGITLLDSGKVPVTADIRLINGTGTTAPTMFWAQGEFESNFQLDYRPTGCGIICVEGQGANTVYSIFSDQQSSNGRFDYNPDTGIFQLGGLLYINGYEKIIRSDNNPGGIDVSTNVNNDSRIRLGSGRDDSNGQSFEMDYLSTNDYGTAVVSPLAAIKGMDFTNVPILSLEVGNAPPEANTPNGTFPVFYSNYYSDGVFGVSILNGANRAAANTIQLGPNVSVSTAGGIAAVEVAATNFVATNLNSGTGLFRADSGALSNSELSEDCVTNGSNVALCSQLHDTANGHLDAMVLSYGVGTGSESNYVQSQGNQPTYFGTIYGFIGTASANAYYDSHDWHYGANGYYANLTLNDSSVGSGFGLNAGVSGTAGGYITTVGYSDLILQGIPNATAGQLGHLYLNPGTFAPTVVSSDALVMGVGRSFILDQSGNVTAHSFTAGPCSISNAGALSGCTGVGTATITGGESYMLQTEGDGNGYSAGFQVNDTCTLDGANDSAACAPAAGPFTSVNGTTDPSTTGVPVDLVTFPSTSNAMYRIYTSLIGDAANYGAFADVLVQGTSARISASNVTFMTLTLSGYTVQATQTTGASQSISFSWVRLM
jgi:hypothetical protein